MTPQNENPEEQILKVNLPIRQNCVEELQNLSLEDPMEATSKLDACCQRWDELGVPLDGEKEAVEAFEALVPELKKKLEELQRSSKEQDELAHQCAREMEGLAKGQGEPSRYGEIEEIWKGLSDEIRAPLQERYEKAGHKAQQALKQLEHVEKVNTLKDLVGQLEDLKENKAAKLSERQNLFRSLRDRIKELNLHTGAQVSTLRERYNLLSQELNQELGWERWSGTKRKEDLVIRAAGLADGSIASSDYRQDLKNIQEEWKNIGFTSREDDALWDKFKAHCDVIFQTVQALQGANEKRREELLQELATLATSEEWRKANDRIQEIQTEWKKLREVSRKAARQQGDAYRAHCDTFYNRRRDHYKEVKEDQKSNVEKKELLVEKVKRLHNEGNWRVSLPKVKDLQEEWKTIGPVPKKKSDALWEAFKEACNVIYEKRREADAEVNAEFEENFKKKEEVMEKIEALLENPDLSAVRLELSSLEKAYHGAGKVPRNKVKSCEGRFRGLLAKHDEREAAAAEEKRLAQARNGEGKAVICEKLEALIFSKEADESSIEDLKKTWEEIGPSNQDKVLKKRYRDTLKQLSGGGEKASAPLSKVCDKNFEAAESLVLKLEQLAGIQSAQISAQAMRQMMVAELQAKMGKGKQFKNKKEEASSLLNDYRGIGLLEPEQREQLDSRIQAVREKLELA